MACSLTSASGGIEVQDYLGDVGAASDCELIRAGFLGQPVNSLTTITFLVAGVWVMRQPRLRWVGVALIATGLGSFVFHGPIPGWSEWAHDVTLAWLILVIGGLQNRWERWSRLPGLAALAVLFAFLPIAADPVAVALTIVVGASIVIRRRRDGVTLAPVALIVAVAVLGRLGATGWPLCNPSSPWQLHGLWHVGAAVGVAWWAMTTIREPVAV